MGSIEMKILIKGAGDLATGIASRLYGAGHQIMMTDCCAIDGPQTGCIFQSGL